MCPICSGDRFIRLPTVHKAYVTLEDDNEPYSAHGTYKEYPCPECQPYFSLDDLQEVSSGALRSSRFTATEEVLSNIWQSIARRIGVHLEQFLSKKRSSELEDMVSYQGSVWVLRPEAQRKINSRRS